MTGKISAGGLNQIFKIISKQMGTNKNILNNHEIENRLVQLSKHSNPYTANLTKNFLKSIR
jgi:flagellar biosynthesis GTPase FlhF